MTTVATRRTRTHQRHLTRGQALRLLRESYSPSGEDSKPEVDWDAGIIRGVKVLGRTSPNQHGIKEATAGTEYTSEAMESALPLYEGRVVNIDHPPRKEPGKDRSSYDRFGKLANARVEAGGIFADLHFLKTHPMAKRICEAARKMPELFGLSHNAMGKGEVRNSKYMIVAIPEVRSVDIVADAGSTSSLFESKESRPMKIKALLEAWLPNVKKSRRPILKKLLEECDEGMKKVMEEDMPADMPPEMAAPADASADPDQALHDGFGAAMKAAVDSYLAGDLDAAALAKKIKEISSAHEKLTAEPEPPPAPVAEDDGEGDDDEETEVPESKKVKAAAGEARELREQMEIRDLIDDAGLKFAKPEGRKAFVKSLVPLTESERKAMIEERKGMPVPAPTSRTRSQGQGTQTGDTPAKVTDGKSFAGAICH